MISRTLMKTLRSAFLCFGASLALLGCAPAALTFTAVESNISNKYFDAIVVAGSPDRVDRLSSSVVRSVIRVGHNYTKILEPELVSAGGRCTHGEGQVLCRLDRKHLENGCFRGKCSKSLKQWTMFISWVDQDGPIEPKVKINMTLKFLPQ